MSLGGCTTCDKRNFFYFCQMFSNSTKYALRTVLFLSQNKIGEHKFTVEDLALFLDIPKPFLSKILQQLSKSGIVNSSKGRGGGFYLSDQNMGRPLMDVILCMEGHDVFDKCILGLPECGNKNPCELHQYYTHLKTGLQKVIKEVSLKDINNEQ